MRVLVRLLPGDQRSPTGLFLPSTVAPNGKDAVYGEVIEVARAKPDEEDDGANVSGIPAGAFVLFAPEAGFRVPWDEQLRVVDTKDVLATVTEIAPEAAH
jgi:co-chaperonin GroES (HSP10)